MRMRIRSVGTALRFAESVLLAPGQQQARRNAWAAVCENREYAADRRHNASAARSARNAGPAGGTGTAGAAGPTRPAGPTGAPGTTGARSVRS
ncbi:hypothetical protein [Kitasatospora sp. SUK 42]|uniref:hypothetical protein n=1 Tax=Kitasatospora sp. SUK 42 TaxID=1588882 RepID=UPI001C318791|nr:hypothetical protein [Kitasatospora sp. SUK 42]MBV2153679.1 hypothetical protein [Kitasatospora sp. SUK 42]